MGGSTKTIVDLSITKLIEDPEKIYKSVMRDVLSNGPKGSRAVMSSLARHIIDNKSLFHSKYLETLGYEPTVNAKYLNIDTDLVKDYIESNTADIVQSISSARYDAPNASEYMLYHLQSNYNNLDLALREFTGLDDKRYKFLTTTVVSSALIEATCYRVSSETVSEHAFENGYTVDIIYEDIETISGLKYWKYRDTTGQVRYASVEYLYLNVEGIDYQAIEYVLSEWNNKIYSRTGTITDNDEMTYTTWNLTAKSKIYLDSDGKINVEVSKVSINYPAGYRSQYYVEAVNGAMVDIKKEIEDSIKQYMANSSEKLVATYIDSNNIQKIIIASVSEELVSGFIDVEAYPIIPLKSNYAFTKDTRERKAVLNKIGMTGSDFESSLSNSSVKHASIMFTIRLDSNDSISNRYIYNLLDNLASTTVVGNKGGAVTTHNVQIKFQGVDLTTKVGMTTQIKSGAIGNIGEIVGLNGTESYTVRDPDAYGDVYIEKNRTIKILRKQINELYYNEIIIRSASSKWRIEGYAKYGKLFGYESENCVLPLIKTAMYGFNLEDSLYMLGKSLSIVAVSITEIKTKWYQTGFFKFVMIVALVAITVLTAGAAGAAAASAYTAAYGAGVASLAVVTTAATIGTIVSTIVYLGGIVSVLGVIGVDTGIAGTIIGVAGLAAGGYVMYLNGLASGVGQISTLQMANGLTGAAKMASDINVKGQMGKMQEGYEELNKRMKELDKEGEELYANVQNGIFIGISDREPDLMYYMSSASYMCNYDSLYDYDSIYSNMFS